MWYFKLRKLLECIRVRNGKRHREVQEKNSNWPSYKIEIDWHGTKKACTCAMGAHIGNIYIKVKE